ncbi:MAG: sugar transferase, partial [Candidatus Doudnabacteria bacterium]|nr:sugar transferase [Candidatus Doudnabacteria bacterium]
MKKLELVFNVIAIFLDACMLLLAGISAFSLRYQARDLFSSYPILFELNLYDFIRIIVIVIPLIVLIMAAYGLYNLRSTTRYLSVLTKVVAGISTGLGIFVIFYFFDQTIFPSRLIVLVSWALAMIFVSIGRVALILIETWFLKQGIGYHRLVVIADEKEDFGITQELAVNPALGYRIVATINDTRNALDQLRMIKDREGIDEILLANQHSTGRLNEEILNFAHDFGIKLNYVPSIIEAQRTNITLSNIGIIPIVELKNTPLDGWGKIVKRVMDIFLSLSALILLSPLFILVIIGIKLDSAGRILFVQDRYGQGRP